MNRPASFVGLFMPSRRPRSGLLRTRRRPFCSLVPPIFATRVQPEIDFGVGTGRFFQLSRTDHSAAALIVSRLLSSQTRIPPRATADAGSIWCLAAAAGWREARK